MIMPLRWLFPAEGTARVNRNGPPGGGLIVEIFGTVLGHVDAGHVEVRSEGKLVGDVRTVRIIIEDGAYFKGSIDIIKPSV